MSGKSIAVYFGRAVPILALVAMWQSASAAIAFPVIDDTRADEVAVEGNKALATAAIHQVLQLKAGGPLTRALVLADIARIEALYQKSGMKVQIWPDMTHPGENDGKPRTLLTYRLIEGAEPRHYSDADDPLEIYYSNTLVCAAAQTGNDLCHLWLNRDGTFINFDAGEAKAGHYTTSPIRPDGKVAVCQHWDTPNMVSPAEVAPQRGGPPPVVSPPAAAAGGARAGGPGPTGAGAASTAPAGAAAGGMPGGLRICKNINHRTVCARNLDPAALSAEERAMTGGTMGDRFYQGNCYPTGPHDVGDVWFEGDDPFPGQLGKDKVFLIKGRR